MAIEIRIPSLGESISQVTIGTILRPSGSQVHADEELLEIETDKLNQVLYAPQTGVVTFSVKQGDQVSVGQVIGVIDTAQKISTDEKSTRLDKTKWLEELHHEKVAEPQKIEPKKPEIAIAETQGQAKQEQTKQETRKKMSSLRKVMAERLLNAQKQTVTLTTFNEADMSQVMALREQYKELFMTKHGVKLGFMSFFVKAACAALKSFPIVNAYLDGDEIVYRHTIDIGVAVSTERGLIVPVLRDCETLSFADIEKQIDDFALRAKSGKLAIEELQGGGFTITNGGVFGSLFSTPLLNPPQSAILGMHKITKRPCVVDDAIVIRPLMYLALSYDHRLLDGKEAVGFLIQIKNCIEDPHRLELGV